jgi:3-hydroxy-3-methylglutaryl CoA synthase
LRAGTAALKAALDAVNAGSAQRVLVTAADCRLGTPQSEFEQSFGDGAAALLIGNSDIAVTIEGSYSHVDEFIDLWRTQDDNFVKAWEDRFILSQGYVLNLREALTNLMQKYRLSAQDFTKVVYYAPDARRHREIAARLGFDYKGQVQDPMFDRLGNTGSAFAPMMLVAALEEAKPGDRILFANYGDGCDAYVLGVTDHIDKLRDRRGIKGYLAAKAYHPHYEKYVSHRQLMATDPARRPPMVSSAPALWRDRNWVLRLHASKCRSCSRLFFPPQRLCLYCGAKDQFDEVRISQAKGSLFTFSKDNLYPSVDPPTIFGIIVLDEEVDGKVKIYCRMTDRDPDKVEVGMPVEMTFRKIHDGAGFPNYYWKCQPIRGRSS